MNINQVANNAVGCCQGWREDSLHQSPVHHRQPTLTDSLLVCPNFIFSPSTCSSRSCSVSPSALVHLLNTKQISVCSVSLFFPFPIQNLTFTTTPHLHKTDRESRQYLFAQIVSINWPISTGLTFFSLGEVHHLNAGWQMSFSSEALQFICSAITPSGCR